MIHSGIDLVSLSKIESLLKKDEDSFVNRICTQREISDLKVTARKIDRVGAYFGLKEAFSKAVGSGIGTDLSFKDIEVTYSPKGQPQINYLGNKFSQLAALAKSCSVSHQDGMLVALVIIEGEIR